MEQKTEFNDAYLKVMEENNLKFEDLPAIIKKRINGYKSQRTLYEKKPGNEKFKNNIDALSIRLGDDIQDYMEDKNEQEQERRAEQDAIRLKKEEEERQQEEEQRLKQEEEQRLEQEQKKKKDQEEAARAAQEKKDNAFGTRGMRDKIMVIIERDGKIKHNALQAIIGKKPDYPRQKVFDIVLEHGWMETSYYKK